MQRDEFLKLGGLAALGGCLANRSSPPKSATTPSVAGNYWCRPALLSSPEPHSSLVAASTQELSGTNFTLKIAPVTVEVSSKRVISTIGYNGVSPGPLLRMKEGVPVTLKIINDTDVPETLHCHGLMVPSEVDGSEEEGTPVVAPHSSCVYTFTPRPAGTHWYHTHAPSMGNLHLGAYTGMFGFLVVDGGDGPGNFDQEHYLALRDWEPYFTKMSSRNDSEDSSPVVKSKTTRAHPFGLRVTSDLFSVNGKALGAGEPIRVKTGQRVLFHLLNASPIASRRIALPGHRFTVIALDGNPVPTPTAVDLLLLGPGERIDCWVEMDQPGNWILGAKDDAVRERGLGVVIEYADQRGQPQWTEPPRCIWDYSVFGRSRDIELDPPVSIGMVLQETPPGGGQFSTFTVNGKMYPHHREFVVENGARYRLTLRNNTSESQTLHLHRHRFELSEISGKSTSGVLKDTLFMPPFGRASVDFTADQPGDTLLGCQAQLYRDFGCKALLRYA